MTFSLSPASNRARLLRNVLLLAWLAVFWCRTISAAAGIPLFSTIATNGPASNRVNLVLFSEGYTNGELPQFLIDSTNAMNEFFSVEPYTEYSNYFNIFAVATNSVHSGSTHLIERAYVAGYTYFNSVYDDSSDYYITIPPNSVDGTSAHGQGKINALLKQFLPDTNTDLPALLVNDIVNGGSDNYGTTAISSIGNLAYILVHESGHTLGGLGDEYSFDYLGYTSVEKPNCTTNTNYLTIKWNAWIPSGTPIPTPGYVQYINTVGAFQGANYHTNGWYRPYFNCCMQSFGGVGFCPVCTEALVLAIYGKVRPIAAMSPPTNSVTNTSAQILTFAVNLLQPATHSLAVQWLTNKVAVSGATNPVFDVWPAELGNGIQKVEADVADPTPMVRNDPNHLLKQTNIWTLVQDVPTMKFSHAKWLANGNFTLQVTGTASAGVLLLTSTNLVQWSPLLTNSFTNGVLNYTNSGSKTNRAEFYRTETPP